MRARTASAPAVALTPAAATGSAECQTRIATASRLDGRGRLRRRRARADRRAGVLRRGDVPRAGGRARRAEALGRGVGAGSSRRGRGSERPGGLAPSGDQPVPSGRSARRAAGVERGRRTAAGHAADRRAAADAGAGRGARGSHRSRAIRSRPAASCTCERRLDAVPSISRAQVEYVPRPSGLADMRAQRDAIGRCFPKSLVAIGGGGGAGDLQSHHQAADQRAHRRRGALRRLVAFPGAHGRAWRSSSPRRRRGAASGASAAHWERQPFELPVFPTAERTIGASASWERLGDALPPASTSAAAPTAGRAARARSARRASACCSRPAVNGCGLRSTLDSWFGDDPFSRGHAVIRPHLLHGQARMGGAGPGRRRHDGRCGAPGHLVRRRHQHLEAVPLRAHRLVVDGFMTTTRIGRTVVHASVEGQHWWATKRGNIGAAAFLDLVSVDRRVDPRPPA